MKIRLYVPKVAKTATYRDLKVDYTFTRNNVINGSSGAETLNRHTKHTNIKHKGGTFKEFTCGFCQTHINLDYL